MYYGGTEGVLLRFGKLLGKLDRTVLGTTLGTWEGFELGSSLGTSDGIELGTSLGTSDGMLIYCLIIYLYLK